ncbi:MAG: aldo/keto reductase [Acidiferrobacterales bacterium]|nr:aldo/keto reductase [Acidiferrobacterales bacterium]
MEYRNLGKSGVKASVLCLGTMMFGGRTDELASVEIIAQAREQGVNFLDTADAYNKGESERVVGRAIRAQRDAWVLATKAYTPMGEGPNERGLSRKWLLQACDASLERIGTDYIDVYYLHKEDLDTPLEETVSAIGDLIRRGKIRYFGVSNFRAWRIAEVCRICDGLGVPRPVVSQPVYNALNRTPEVEHLPACTHYGLGVYPYSPLARGVLTGKYTPDAEPPPDTRAAVKDKRMMETEWRRESLVIAQRIKEHAESRGTTAAHLALAWVLYNKLITGVVAGPRTLEQWESYVKGLAYRFTSEDEAFVDALVPPGHPSAHGYTDPAYPLEGRVPMG